ncbi:hypothetical protein C8R41DRAFT_166179 [Lentinula lateritia]|uniref:Alpha-ketoglutarate-dependent dioxygenase AlkB-like domain-containing protein n=1 Tax=Lentinula lateritia TaxID=40482 RepID=A0ABQ8VPC5_9AGAR|nr:hypothetical protein C8R41DRAFT_166179 [Lentinula lateritia]
MLHSKRALEEESEHLSVKTIKLIHHSNSENQLLETHHGHTCFPTPSEDQKFKSHGSNDHGNMSTERPFTDKQGKMIKPDVVLQELHVMPHIWAESRQEVCESFDWFRSYQGGVYFANNITKGYLLSGFPAKRDGFFHNGKLIISHGGGKAESVQQLKGETKVKHAEDQKAEDKSVRALLTNYRQQIPLVLLIDDRYALFPYNLGGKNITYAVLGVYNITHAWAEYETTKSGQKHVRFKFSFQWCKEQGEPWWHATKDKIVEERATLMPVVSSIEDTIDASPENDNARTSESDYEEAMDISPDDERIPSTTAASPGNAAPKFSRRMPVKKTEFLLSERIPASADRRCMYCDMRSPLVFSVGWGCLNATCTYFWRLPEAGNNPIPDDLTFDEGFLQLQTLIPLDSGFRNINPSQPVTNPQDKITTLQAFTRGMHCIKCGRLSCRSKWEHWECANCQNVLAVNGAPRPVKVLKNLNPGVNFQWYFVGKDTGIMRSPVKPFGDHQTAGNVLTFSFPEGRGQIHHIQHNSMGPLVRLDTLFEEYQTQAADGSLPFRRWPLRSHKLRGSLLTNYFSQNCGVPYHYVGGTANTLTWEEAPTAVVKAKEFIEERTNLALNKQSEFNEVLSAAYMEKQKMSFHTDDEKGLGSVVAGLSLGSPALMHFRRRNVKQGPERKICLSIVLRHGDVLVMDGTGVQQYYEHMVEPINFRIAATARYIDPDRK